jgi:hypothetical protein
LKPRLKKLPSVAGLPDLLYQTIENGNKFYQMAVNIPNGNKI